MLDHEESRFMFSTVDCSKVGVGEGSYSFSSFQLSVFSLQPEGERREDGGEKERCSTVSTPPAT